MKVKGQLERAQLENLSADPSTSVDKPDGRLWLNTTGNVIKAYVQAAIRTLVTTDQTQTLTNKTLTSPTITSASLSSTTIDGGTNTVQNVPLTAIATVLGDANKVVTRDASGVIQSSTNLTIPQGGTGATTKTAAFDALNPNTTKGDVTVFNGTNNVRQAVGTNGYVLTADSAQANGLKWAAASVTPTIQSKSAGYTALNTDDFIICTGSTSFTITLYAANSGSKPLIIKNAGSAIITISRAGSDLIDNETTQTLQPLSAVSLIPDGSSNFWVY